MAARKLQQEVDKCFKKVNEGVAEFEAIYEKIEQSNNASQKEKLEDNLKKEIKKLQRLRDQIKTWATSNDIKDKAPLLEHRKLIETQMEKFKAVEKAMKTKAYSKEGLSAAAKLDPKEIAKIETCDFLSSMVEQLEQQVEAMETEIESINPTLKKGKNQAAKLERISTIENRKDKHKWHMGKLELIRRLLENGGIETEQVKELEESIKYYVSDSWNNIDEYMSDDEMYDDLDLQEDEEAFGMNMDNDRVSSQDTQSIQEEVTEAESRPSSLPPKTSRTVTDATSAAVRRPSAQLKSPLATLSTLAPNPLNNVTNGSASSSSMKPASVPSRPAGETLKYASAAAAAAASDKNNLGIAPLPPPPGSLPISTAPGISPLPPAQGIKTSATSSPSTSLIQPVLSEPKPPGLPTPLSAAEPKTTESSSVTSVPSTRKAEKATSKSAGKAPAVAEPAECSRAPQTNGVSNGVRQADEEKEEESIYHLPAALQDLVESYEITKKRTMPVNSPSHLRMMQASQANAPDQLDAEAPRRYRPEHRFLAPSHYPQEPLAIFDDARLYSRIEPDTLFYVFYYKQNTYHQYLAAKALKDQSWRFHKQYQTWFQRHEEPKSITEEFEQGTYRFFDYESTWMNRRKADFKFAYRFLEDEV